MFPFQWLSALQDQFLSCQVKGRRRRQLQQHSAHHPRIARAVSLHAAETLEERMLLTTFTVVNTNDSGDGSLRAAIEAANAEAGADEITFADALRGLTIALTDELQITDDLTIDGLDGEPWRGPITIDAGHHSRIFNINGNALSEIDVTLSGLSLINGSAAQGGAILNHENLTLSEMAFSENHAAGVGGAISSYGIQLTISNSLFEQNTAGSSGGGIYSLGSRMTVNHTSFISNSAGSNGGGIYRIATGGRFSISDGTSISTAARIEDCLFSDNTAVSGGGIFNVPFQDDFGSCELSILSTSFQKNTASDSGGGIYNGRTWVSIVDSSFAENKATRGGAIDSSHAGRISVSNSTVSDNIATGDGGGIAFLGSLTITNCTLSGNQAGGSGGGIFRTVIYPPTEQRTLPLVLNEGNLLNPGLLLIPGDQVTDFSLAGSSAAESSTPAFEDGIPDETSIAILDDSTPPAVLLPGSSANLNVLDSLELTLMPSSLKISSSTITGNSAGFSGGGLAGLSGIDAQINNSIVAGNFANENSQIQGSFDGGFNIIQASIDGLLDPVLRDNGGPTLTHALLAGSAAVDAGDNQRVTASGLVTDQRGGAYQRIYAGTVDIGAVEFHGLNLVVDTLSDEDDGDYSSGHLSLREAIKLANQTLDTDQISFSNALAGGTILLESELLISSGMHIVGLGQGQLTLDGGHQSRIFRINDGDTSTNAGVEISGLSLKHGHADQGGAVLNYEDLLISDVALSENEATGDGGAIYHAGGQLTVSASLFSYNSARKKGGGIYNSHQDLIVEETTFYRNESEAGGGGLYSIYGSRLKQSSPNRIPGPAFPVFRSQYAPVQLFNFAETEYNVVAIIHSSFLENEARSGGGVYMTQDNYRAPCIACDTVGTQTGTAADVSGEVTAENPYTGNSIVGCTFVGNTASNGGGLLADSGLSVSESTFSENVAILGGGIYHNTRSLKILNSTVSGNSATGYGAGIYSNPSYFVSLPVEVEIDYTLSPGDLLTESGDPLTVNEFDSATDAAVFHPANSISASSSMIDSSAVDLSDSVFYFSSGSLHIQNSTITGNSAGMNGGGLYLTNVNNRYLRSAYDITNSIIAGNSAPENAQVKGEYDGGFNIIQDSIDGLLDPVLRDNGGPTKTHALLPDSAAINAGSNAAAEAAGLTTDQRGGTHQRIFAGTVDIGAVEMDAFSLVVDTLSDEDDGDYSAGQLSLREAVRLANVITGADTITFAEALAGQTIFLNSELLISDSLTIEGDADRQIVIDAGYQSRLLNIDDGTESVIDVTLKGLTLTHGRAELGGAILNRENLFLSDSTLSENVATQNGGGIYHAGELLQVTGSSFTGNLAGANGGGIYNATRNLKISDSLFQRNVAIEKGGGVFNYQGVLKYEASQGETGTLWGIVFLMPKYRMVYSFATINDTRFIENSAKSGGGIYDTYNYVSSPPGYGWNWISGISVNQDFPDLARDSSGILLSGTTFVGNTAVWGGGIFHDQGQITISSSTLSENVAHNRGGGIMNLSKLTIENSTIKQNRAWTGAGISSVSFNSVANISGSTLAENIASSLGGGVFCQDGQLYLSNSTISGNHAGLKGGGIYFVDDSYFLPPPPESVPYIDDLVDVSLLDPDSSNALNLSDHSDSQGSSSLTIEVTNIGGPARLVLQADCELIVNGCTITGNSAEEAGGGVRVLSWKASTQVSFDNCIIAGNSAADSAQVAGEFDGGFNIIQDSIDGLLDPVLRDNGGPTWTHALLPGSAAINAGNNAAVAEAGLTTDQRGEGYQRIKEGTVDIGAVEVQAPFTQVDLRFVNSRTRTPGSGEKSRLPENRTWIDEWGNHWLEIWISTPDSNGTGIQSAGFNLNYNPAIAQARSIEFGPAFSGNQSGTIDNSTGTITGLSAETTRSDVGDDQYVLFARVLFESALETRTGADAAGVAERVVNPEFTLTRLNVQLAGGARSEAVQGAPLDTILWRNLHAETDSASSRTFQYPGPDSLFVSSDWWNDSGIVKRGFADDASQLSLIVLPFSQASVTENLYQPLPADSRTSPSQPAGSDPSDNLKPETTEPADWDSLADSFFSELNDLSELLAF